MTAQICNLTLPISKYDCWNKHTANQACCHANGLYNQNNTYCYSLPPPSAIPGVADYGKGLSFFDCGNYHDLYPNSSLVKCGKENGIYSVLDCDHYSTLKSKCCLFTQLTTNYLNNSCFMSGSYSKMQYSNKIGNITFLVTCDNSYLKIINIVYFILVIIFFLYFDFYLKLNRFYTFIQIPIYINFK
jgi:hypothetical protein